MPLPTQPTSFTAAGRWSLSQVQQPDSAGSSSVLRQSQDPSELPEDQMLKQHTVLFSEEPQGWLSMKPGGRDQYLIEG